MPPLAALRALPALAALTALAGSPGAQQYFATQPPVLAAPLFFQTGATGDVDGDGDRDLVVCSGLMSTPRLFVNDGDGSFIDATSTLPLPPGGVQLVQSTTLVDFDGDGDLDLFVSAMIGSYLLRNLGGGTWAHAASALPPSLPPGTFVAADFDGDGDQDLAGAGFVINYGRNQLLENVGGTFVARDPFPGGAFDIAAVDVDGDGDVDLCVTGQPRLYRNDGQLVFTDVTAPRLPPLSPPLTMCRFGDLDGDGAPELVLSGPTSNADLVLRNVGGSFAVAPAVLLPVVTPTRYLTLADVDGDGDLDLLRTRSNAAPLLSRNDGTGVLTDDPAALPAIVAAGALLLADDLDRDGDIDAALLPSSGPNALLWNRHRHLAMPAPPQRGQTWTLELWSQPGYGAPARRGFLAIGLVRHSPPLVVQPHGVLWLDLATPFVAAMAPLPAGAAPATFSLAVPNVPQIAGIVLHAQGLVEEGPAFASARLTSVISAAIQ